jgi:HSP20 family molecular chaperone IbpA
MREPTFYQLSAHETYPETGKMPAWFGVRQGPAAQEENMPGASQAQKAQTVQVVEADVLDRMNETRELIAQRAYEIFQSRGDGPGSEEDDWLTAEGELVPKIEVDTEVTDGSVKITTKVPGFDAKDLEVVLGHREAVICGVHVSQAGDNGRLYRKVMRIVELPFDVDPSKAKATLNNGTLRVQLPCVS